MTLYLFANDAVTTLAGPIASNSTTCNLAAGTGALFPSPTAGQQFAVTFIKAGDASGITLNEIAYVTARSGDTLTIVRGQEGTTAKAWSAGDSVENLWTAGSATSMVQRDELQRQPGNFAGTSTGSANAQTIVLNPVPSSILGIPIRFIAGFTNSASVIITLTGIGSAGVLNPDGTTLGAGQIIVGAVYEIIFNGTAWILMGNPYAVLSRANTWNNTNTFNGTTNLAGTNISGLLSVFNGANVTGNLAAGGQISSGGQIVAGGQIVSTGNTTASGGRLRATLGAYGSGDINAATILNDFPGGWSAGDIGYQSLPNGFALQMQGVAVPCGGGFQSTVVNMPHSFSGGMVGAVISFLGTSPPGADNPGSICVQPASNSTVLVTTNYPNFGSLGVVILAFGFNVV